MEERAVTIFDKKQGENISFRPQDLIEARYKLSSRQNDVIDILLSKIKGDSNLRYTIRINDYIHYYSQKLRRNHIYEEFKKVVDSIKGEGINIKIKASSTTAKRNKDTEIYYPWFSKIKYINSEAKIELDLHPEMKFMLLQAKNGVYYNLKYSLRLENDYAKRFYYYCHRYVDTGVRKDIIEDLHFKLECPESYRKNFTKFEARVLKVAREQINQYSDININYTTIRKGNKVTHLLTTIKAKTKEELGAMDNDYNQIELKKENIDYSNDEPIRIKILNSINPYMELIKKAYENGKSSYEMKRFNEIKRKLSEEYNISVRTLNRYININIFLIKEFVELFDKNFISVTIADSYARLPIEEQEKEFKKFKRSISSIRKRLCSQLSDLLDEYNISYTVAEKYSKKTIDEQIDYYNKTYNKKDKEILNVEYKVAKDETIGGENEISIDSDNDEYEELQKLLRGKDSKSHNYIKDIINIMENIRGVTITEKSAEEIYKCAISHKEFGNNPLGLVQEVAQYSLTQDIKKNFISWFKTTVENYNAPIKLNKENKLRFNNFKGRDYDYDELEKKLLGWD